jgi:arylsulfatase A-like enzyme
MSGKYPATVGVTDWIDLQWGIHPCRGKLIDAPYIKELPISETSLATALRDGGYQTWHVGKWHLGLQATYPEKHGFDANVGGCEWGSPQKGYFAPWGIPVLPGNDVPVGTYLTDYLTDRAIRLLQNRDPSKPFFMNFWHYAVHTPIQAPAELVAKYKAKAERLGLDKVKALEEGEYFPIEHKRNQRVMRRLIQSDPTYAAMVENMDSNIGRLLQALDESGQADNTIVIFTSDNGGVATAEGSPTTNRPLAEGKGWMYEGGTREPLLIRWPGVIRPGSKCTTPMTSPDFYPTLLEAAGLPLRPKQHCDGVSFMPLLRDSAADFSRGPMFWHYPHYGNQGGTPGCSVRDGDYKLIEFFEDHHVELYNLREDISEDRDLAQQLPDVVSRLRGMLHDWLKRVEAKFPAPNPDWNPREQ